MKPEIKLSKKDLREGLSAFEDRIQTFEIYLFLILASFIISVLLHILVNGFAFEPVSWYLYSISLLIIGAKITIAKLFQLGNFDNLTEVELNKKVADFTSYFLTKRKRRDNKEIDNILKRITLAELHFKKSDKRYKVNNFLSILSIYIVTLFLIMLLNVFLSGKIPNSVFFNSAIIFIYPLNAYLIIVFIIRDTHIKNLERSKNLFKISISKVIDELADKIEEFALFLPQEDFINSINENKITDIIQDWFNKYLGNFQDDLENNKFLYVYHDFIIDQKTEEYFLGLFMNIKAKLQVFSGIFREIPTEESELIEKISHIEKIIDYIIDNLKFNIDYKKSKKEERRGKINLASSFAIVFSTIFSILAFFFPL